MTPHVVRQEGSLAFRSDGIVEITDTWVMPEEAEAERVAEAPRAASAPPPVTRLPQAGRPLAAILSELQARSAVLDREIEARRGMEAERRQIQRLIRAATKQTKGTK